MFSANVCGEGGRKVEGGRRLREEAEAAVAGRPCKLPWALAGAPPQGRGTPSQGPRKLKGRPGAAGLEILPLPLATLE